MENGVSISKQLFLRAYVLKYAWYVYNIPIKTLLVWSMPTTSSHKGASIAIRDTENVKLIWDIMCEKQCHVLFYKCSLFSPSLIFQEYTNQSLQQQRLIPAS